MKEDNKNKINRRDFFKLAGAGTLASAAALYGCSGNKNNGESESAALGEISTDKMTYRTNPNTGDRVSLLGYGCMRWPTRKRADGNGDEIDQEAVVQIAGTEGFHAAHADAVQQEVVDVVHLQVAEGAVIHGKGLFAAVRAGTEVGQLCGKEEFLPWMAF